MPCLVCGELKTIKAHVMPRALFHEIRAGANFALVGTRDRDGATFSQSGMWDKDILCETHERHLQDSDDYAVEFCRTFETRATKVDGAPGYMVPNPRPELLTRFVMSVFWRFAVSKFGKAAGVRLGPYEGRLQSLVFDPATPLKEPDIVVIRHEYQIDGRTINFATHPHSARVKGLIQWQFNVASFDFRMKLDARPDGLPSEAYANGRDPLLVVDTGPEDVRNVPAFTAIFDRIGTGPSKDRWLATPEAEALRAKK